MLSQPGEYEASQDLSSANKWTPQTAPGAHRPESRLKPSLLISVNKNNFGAATTGQPCGPITSSLGHRPQEGEETTIARLWPSKAHILLDFHYLYRNIVGLE